MTSIHSLVYLELEETSHLSFCKFLVFYALISNIITTIAILEWGYNNNNIIIIIIIIIINLGLVWDSDFNKCDFKNCIFKMATF